MFEPRPEMSTATRFRAMGYNREITGQLRDDGDKGKFPSPQ
jgi:hypothetical protein